MIKINNKHKDKHKSKNTAVQKLFIILLFSIIGYLAFQIGVFLSNWSEKNINVPTSNITKNHTESEKSSPEQDVVENTKQENEQTDLNTVINPSDLLDTITQNENNYVLTGYIDSLKSDSLDIDEIEIISPNDSQRIEELNLNPNEDFMSGYYIYNNGQRAIPLRLSESVEINLIDFESPNMTLKLSDLDSLGELLNSGKIPFRFTIMNNEITKITQIYIP